VTVTLTLSLTVTVSVTVSDRKILSSKKLSSPNYLQILILDVKYNISITISANIYIETDDHELL